MAFNFNWKPQDLSYQQYQFLSNPDEAFKNKANTKLAQEMLGFEGNDIDGVAGKATRKAYNNQMPYYKDFYGTVSKAGALDLNDPTAFYNDIHDAEAYSFSPQEAENELNTDIQAEEKQVEAQKQAKIKDIQDQITAIEQRIAANRAKLNDWNTNQIAAIEARKINSTDPTSIWRWKVDRDEARRIAKDEKDKNKQLAKANALIESNNILGSMIINDSLDTPTKNAMLSKLADVKTNLEKNGLPTKDVDKKIELLKGNGEQTSREQSTTDFETLLNNPNLSVELLDKFEATNPNLSRANWGRLDNKRAELTNKANKINLNKRYEAARKKAGIDKPTWDLLSKAKKKEILDNSGL